MSTEIERETERRTRTITVALGGSVRAGRRAAHLTQRQLGARIRVSQATISKIERGHGGRVPLETWIALGTALDRPLAVSIAPSASERHQPADAGHLRIQEHILSLAAATGRPGTFELPTRPDDPSRSTDVGIRDSRTRVRILAECWNTFGDLGAAVRATHRKSHEAAATWPEDRIATVWIVAATAANRRLLARYPSIISAAFPASSRAWLRALESGDPPPREPGLVWFDPTTTRLLEHRRPRPRATMTG